LAPFHSSNIYRPNQDLGEAVQGMALSKENPSGSSQLQSLLDLLIDLEVVNSTTEPKQESAPDEREVISQDEACTSQLVEEHQDSPSDASPESTPERENPSTSTEDEISLTSLPVHSLTSLEPSDADKFAIDDSLKAIEGLQNLLSQPIRQDEQQDESKNQAVESEANLNQLENTDKPSEEVFKRLIQSHWQKAQHKESSQFIASTSDKEVHNSIELFERWQRLLLTQEVMDSREAIANFKKKIESLEHQIYEPKELTDLLLPLVTEVLTLKVAVARKEIAQAIAPLTDEMIQIKAQQDKGALCSALAPVLPDAVAQQVNDSPGDFAKALGPEMGTAIKEQINLDRDAMVDALYPVIGSTISKYMAEAIKSINEKVENTLSLEGISRKIRAKVQGVSEAELIFKEAMPFTVQAVFLIHKGSGLVISVVQRLDSQRLESDMVAGMLTAIRSFVNDCIAQTGEVSEIDQIDYGNSKITLEVAGYCYLAVVSQGQASKAFTGKMRSALATIVQAHDRAIELFDGDPAKVPEQIHEILGNLTTVSTTSGEKEKGKVPTTVLLISFAVLSTISLSLGIYQYRGWVSQRIEAETSFALASEPELAVYRLGVDYSRGTLKLSGKLPNQYLRSKAEQIAKAVQPKLKINNSIIPVEVPPDPVATADEVKRVTDILNQMDGAVILADYTEGKVTVQGVVLQKADARKVTLAFQQIPGVKTVTNTVELQAKAFASRIYFERGSSELKSAELSKVSQIQSFLEQYPNTVLRLLGYSDALGTSTENQQMALARATSVRNALVTQGIDPKRLQVEGTSNSPIGLDSDQPFQLSRCVEFEIVTP